MENNCTAGLLLFPLTLYPLVMVKLAAPVSTDNQHNAIAKYSNIAEF